MESVAVVFVLPSGDSSGLTHEVDPPDGNPSDFAEQAAYVEGVLSKISDGGTCAAFRLQREGVPFSGEKRAKSLARELNISPKTGGGMGQRNQSIIHPLCPPSSPLPPTPPSPIRPHPAIPGSRIRRYHIDPPDHR